MLNRIIAYFVGGCILLYLFLTFFGTFLFDEGTLYIFGVVLVLSFVLYYLWIVYWGGDRYPDDEDESGSKKTKTISLKDYIKRRDS